MITPLSHSHWIHYYGEPTLPLRNGFPKEPVKMVIITSIRDVLGDDRNGQMIRTSGGPRYMEGATERLIRETRDGELGKILRIVGIITDDLPRDEQRLGIDAQPKSGRPWIHPLDLRDDQDELVTREDFTHCVPSTFRALPINAVDERAREKALFEDQVLAFMREKGADLLLSDHLMLRAERIVFGTRGKLGTVLNVHPAVTIAGHPFRFTGKSPTKDAIAHADAGKDTFTGATLHMMDSEIDHGPVIAFSAKTPVHPGHDPMELRYDNYQYAKLPVLIAGLRHYIHHILPHLGDVNLNSLSPLNDVCDPYTP